jgi:hypothetical protein
MFQDWVHAVQHIYSAWSLKQVQGNIGICFEIHMWHINTLCEQYIEFLNVKAPVGT